VKSAEAKRQFVIIKVITTDLFQKIENQKSVRSEIITLIMINCFGVVFMAEYLLKCGNGSILFTKERLKGMCHLRVGYKYCDIKNYYAAVSGTTQNTKGYYGSNKLNFELWG